MFPCYKLVMMKVDEGERRADFLWPGLDLSEDVPNLNFYAMSLT